MRNRVRGRIAGAALGLAVAAGSLGAQEESLAAGKDRGRAHPRMDVVFVLDTTGSMAGLIQTAKEKIWAIANEILRGKPTPVLRIGLVAYRDRGDEYVTRVFELTNDLDQVHRNLMGLSAGGGGDTPEHVNKALHDAVHAMAWTEVKGAVKMIFLVGDAPPHLDYGDGFDYRRAAREAIGRGIMVNTLRIGAINGTAEVWQEIARLADGSYKEIKVATMAAPAMVASSYDKRLEELRRKVGRTAVDRGMVAYAALPAAEGKMARPGGPSRGAADEGPGDLVADIVAGRVKIESVPEARLGPELKKLAGEARVEKLRELVAERKTLLAELADLEKKRNDEVAEKLKERAREASLDKDADGFGRAVVETVKKAASKAGIRYDEKKPEEKKPGEEKPAEKKPEEKGM